MQSAAALRLSDESVAVAAPGVVESPISRALKSVREHLGMEVAYVSEFVGNQTVFREVDAPGLEHLIKVGDSRSLDDVYCRHILEGRLPNVMSDTSQFPLAAEMPITAAVPIGKHISVPLKLADGEVYGMFCCLGPAADPSLNDRDLQTMKVFADFAAHEIHRDLQGKREAEAKAERIAQVMRDGQMSPVYQPIVDIKRGRIVGFESLTRFSATPYRTPDVWFKEAAEVDRGPALEFAAIRLALEALKTLPADVYIGVNASPDTITADGFIGVFAGLPLHRIVLEVTEHAEVKDYDALRAVIDPLRDRGIRLAVDDAGAGYSGLQHILKLQPDLIKLDLALTRNIDADIARRALAAALVNFAGATDCQIIAEGVENDSELQALKHLGVQKAQGYFLARPLPLADARCLLEYGLKTHPKNRDTGSARQTVPDAVAASACEKEYGPQH